MAETHTVGLSQTYADLATAIAAQDGSMSGRGVVTFECHQGADLGEADLTGFTNINSSDRVVITVVEGERHDGTNNAIGAYMTVAAGTAGIYVLEDYTRVQFLRFDMDNAAGFLPAVYVHNMDNTRITGCVFRVINVTGGHCIFVRMQSDLQTAILINNTFYGNGDVDLTTCMKLELENAGAGAIAGTILHSSTSVHDSGGDGVRYEADQNGAGACALAVTETDCVCTDSDDADFADASAGGGVATIARTYGVASDATAGAGTGNKINKSAASCYETPGTNVIPLEGGELQDAGTPVAGYTVDAVGTIRPQGPAWDIGSIERPVTGGPAPFYTRRVMKGGMSA